MARTRRPAPAGRPGQDEDREQRIAALRIRLHETAGQIRSAGDWARYLRAAARLHGETWANVLLISSRIPDATLVRGYQAWRAAGRQVNRDEKGIEIFSGPRRREPGRHGAEEAGQDHSWRDAQRVAYVWDLSQTTGQPVPLPPAFPAPAGEAPPGLWDCLCWLARREGFAVEREDGSPGDGTTFWAARRIRILPGLPSGQAAWALAHQLGHVLLHNTTGYPPGTTTSGCHGIRKAEADSVAFIICARHSVRVEHAFSSPQTWRAAIPVPSPQPPSSTAGERITTAAAKISRLLDHHLAGNRLDARPAAKQLRPQAMTNASRSPPHPRSPRRHHLRSPTRGSLVSWTTPCSSTTASSPGAGYPPTSPSAASATPRCASGASDTPPADGPRSPATSAPSATTTTRSRPPGSPASPPAARSSTTSGTGSCSRSMMNAGTSRVPRPRPPGNPPEVPKYLNSPETGSYQKGSLLFGLHQARDLLARGATPVIVEGPFDAIAVTVADPGRHAGLAPCGTALTSKQAAILAQAADLGSTGVLVAFDDDQAGRKAAVRAYDILRTVSGRLQSAVLSGKDPAEILQAQRPGGSADGSPGPGAPLSAVVIDAHLAPWERRLQDPEGPLLAMRSTATVIAGLLPAGSAEAIRQITGNRELATVDEQMRPVANPELPEIARVLPADAAYQTMRVAERLGFTDYSDVLAEVANAVTRDAARPGNPAAHRAPNSPQAASRIRPRLSATVMSMWYPGRQVTAAA